MSFNPALGVAEGLREIWSHKFRSLLSMLGIILAVASLMATIAVTTGMSEGIRRTLIEWGGVNRVQILSVEPPEEQLARRDVSPGLTYRDVVALRSLGNSVEYVVADKRLNRGIQLHYKGRQVWTTRYTGTEPDYLRTSRFVIATGRMFNDIDIERRHRVIVLGHMLAEALSPAAPDKLLEQTIRVDNELFRVIGIFESSGSRWHDRFSMIPLSTLMELYFSAQMQDGIDLGPDPRLDRIYVGITDPSQMDSTLAQMRGILLQNHRGIQDFGFETREDWADAVAASVRGVGISGGLISLVTLIAAGVGVTNIMLASIKERTREIGIRRAVGARAFDIFLQILMEALVLAILGGLLGLVAGHQLVALLSTVALPEQAPILTPQAAWISLAVAGLVGFFAGLAPALKAASLRPIEALRFE